MKQGSIQIWTGPLQTRYNRAVGKSVRSAVVPKIMRRQPGVYSAKADIRKLIGNRLGWVDSAVMMKRRVGAIERFGQAAIADGIRHVVLMGMGGSSLCPELFKLVWHKHAGLTSFDVLDSTDPAAVKALVRKLTPKKTLCIVASKSGGTVETRSHEAFFRGWFEAAGIREIGRHFAAITDSGSSLHTFARRCKYRKVFLNPADIGGRYSALSYFGLVPGYFAGVDLRALLDDAVMMQKIIAEREDETNPAVVVGSFMAAAAGDGRDKMTFVASKKTSSLVPWVEQLVAESTGKKKRGIVPVENEPSAEIEKYGKDRFFVFLRMVGERTAEQDKFKANLKRKHFPFIDIVLGSKNELGRQFLLWEASTALVGWHLGINPFDEPNVTESKNNTRAILSAFERSGQFPDQSPESYWGKLCLIAYDGVRKYSAAQLDDITKFMKRFFSDARPPQYAAFLNYFKADRRTEVALEKIRKVVRDKTGMATTRGYGPRFLHSIGQLYKGGPANGMFIVFVKGNYGRLPIPGQVFDFGQLIAAQAIGDSQALIKRGLPTLVISIDGKAADGLEIFSRAVSRALR